MEQGKREVDLRVLSRNGSDRVEQRVRATLYERAGKLYYHYEEPATEMGRVTATIRVDKDTIRLLRQGDIRSEQQFRVGARLPGYYDTPHGRFELDTETRSLQIRLEKGIGTIAWSYDLFVNGEATGRYELTIEASIRK